MPIAENDIPLSAEETYLLSAHTNPAPIATGGAEVTAAEGSLMANGPQSTDGESAVARSSNEISVYTVRNQNGRPDTLSEIAEMYGVTVNTIMWANDISNPTHIKEGDTLVILPIAGVQHEIEEDETVSSIVEEYDADLDEVLAFNNISIDTPLEVGETLMIPGGELHSAPSVTSSAAAGVASSMTHPAPGAVRTQGLHGYNAVDLAGGEGSLIRAAAAGEVIVARVSGWNGGYGNYVVIRHAGGVQTLYAHLSSVSVRSGDWVNAGAMIGGMGTTGRSTGTHLHFEVRGGYNPF